VVLAPGARSTARLPVCGGDGGVPEVSITALGPSVGAGATVPPRLEAVSATSDGGAG
jgi:hypothetical protein